MSLIAALFATSLAVSIVPLASARQTAGTEYVHPANTHLVKAKVKQHKVKGRKAPKIKNKSHSRVN
jgi:hypothetical protein